MKYLQIFPNVKVSCVSYGTLTHILLSAMAISVDFILSTIGNFNFLNFKSSFLRYDLHTVKSTPFRL